MDLYLSRADFDGVFNEIRDQYNRNPEYNGGDLFAYKYGALKKGEMEFGLGMYDSALFYHHHPYDSEDYSTFSVRSIYEELVLIKKNKIPQESIISEQRPSGEWINIGRMIERRELRNEEIILKEWQKSKQPDNALITSKDIHRQEGQRGQPSLRKKIKDWKRPKLR